MILKKLLLLFLDIVLMRTNDEIYLDLLLVLPFPFDIKSMKYTRQL
jgi:hypothetical protein